MLPKKHRLKHRAAFQIVFKKGCRVRGKYGMFIGLAVDSGEFPGLYSEISKNASSQVRFGFVVSKKIGKAYYRNKFKRVLSSIVYEFMREGGIKSLEKLGENSGAVFLAVYIAFKPYDEFSLLKKEVSGQLSDIVGQLTQRA